ncbi:hypothetical protein FHG66_11240 [Rubellimicrobium rubrum]|uniref:Uncharacterized protein n=1 Tax=Rubellimicrobium rubrum TaxID=2585369 RepID=A0A5C4MUM8_9RHOB|nr:hypothetical protein [Rubellimicrobium rubrum]TNC49306.1 hypothetical protein FHG66_11240 [Rubellimicrobium rubrum]
MLFALQHRAADGRADWKKLGTVIERLAPLVCRDVSLSELDIDDADWWIGLGRVDLHGSIITIQRGDTLIAAFDRRDDGRLRTTVYHPLCARAIRSVIGLGSKPHPEHGVNMRPDNWDYAGDCAALNGNVYAAKDGCTYLSSWHKGLGADWEGRDDPVWILERKNAWPRSTGFVATEIKVFRRMTALMETLPPCEVPQADELPEEYARPQARVHVADAEPPPAPLTSYDLSTQDGRLGFFVALYDDYQEDGLLPAVNHVWDNLAKPKGVRCALMAQKVGKSGTGRRALIRFIKRFLQEILYEFHIPDLPLQADYASFDDWNRACRAMFAEVDERLFELLSRYEAILDGRDPEETQAAPAGIVIKGPWGRGKPNA